MLAVPQLYFPVSNTTAVPYPTAASTISPSGNTPRGSTFSSSIITSSPGIAPYPILSSGPVTAAPSSSGVSNFPTAGIYTIPGTGSDDNITTVHLTSFKHITITKPRLGGCTINAPNVNLLYWNSATYSYSSTQACPILPESSGGVVLASIVTQAPYTFPVSLHAASTRFINFSYPGVVSVGNYTTTNTFTNHGTTQTFTESAFTDTYTHNASSETLTGSGITTTITQSAYTATGSGTAGTRTYTGTGNTQTGTYTEAIYSTSTSRGPIDVLRPDITYNGATYAYTATTPTPYVFFSVLEIERASSTSTITVPVPFLSAYPDNPYADWSGNASATGALPSSLIGQLAAYENANFSDCAVGTFRGQATLDVGISIYESVACAAPARGEKTASGLGAISANPGGALAPTEPLTTSVAPAAPPPTSPGQSVPPPTTQADIAPSANSSPRVLTPVTGHPFPASSPPPGSSPPSGSSSTPGNSPSASSPPPGQIPPPESNPPGPANNSPAPQPSQQQAAPQALKSPTITQGLGEIILSGLGATQAPNPGTQPENPPPAPTIVTLGNVPVAISSNNVIINGQTISPASGLPPLTTTVGNQPVIINPSQVVASGTTVAIPNPVNLPAITIVPAQQPPVITVGNSAITANSQSHFVVSGQTLAPGGPPITVDGTPLSLAPSASSVVIGGTTISLLPTPAVPLPTVAGQQIQTAANGNIIVPGTTTLSPGANAATISGTVVSVMSNGAGLVVGGTTVALPVGAPTSLPTVSGQQIQLASNGNIILPGGTTVSAGGSAATISGTPVSVLPHGAGVVIGTSTVLLPVGAASPLPTVKGQQLQRGPNGNIIIPGLTTLLPGSAAATVSGSVISVASNGAAVIVGGSTISLAPTANALPSITFSGSTIIANFQTQLVIAGQTLSPGSIITVSGTPISLAPGASSAIIGGTTFSLSPIATAKPLPSMTFGGSAITENSKSQLVIAGQTLSPGSAITVSGTIISLAPGASDVVVGGNTAFLAIPTGSAGNITSFTGAAMSERAVGRGFVTCIALGIGLFFGVVVL